jgi:hypothetical protein
MVCYTVNNYKKLEVKHADYFIEKLMAIIL